MFDRKTHVLPLKSKEPKEVLAKFNEILTKFGITPKRLDVDSGNEFAGAFLEGMRAKNIEVHVRSTKPTADVNFLAVGDSAIQKIKSNVAKRQAAEKSTKWADKIEKAADAYNMTGNDAALYGNAPNDIATDPVARYRIREDQGKKLLANSRQLKARQEKLQEQGAFRAMLPKQTFKTGFKPTYGGQIYKADSIEGNMVKSGDKTFPISKVMPVDPDTAKVEIPKSLVAGSEQRSAAKKNIMAPFEARLKAFVGDGRKTVKDIGVHMKAGVGFENALSQARMNKPGGIKEFVKMFADLNVTEGLGQAVVTRKRFRRTEKSRP